MTRIKQLEQRLTGVVRQFDHTLGGGTSNRRTMRSTGGTMAHQDALTSKSAGGTGTQPNHQQQRNAWATATTHDNGNSSDNKLPDIYKRVGSASPSATTRQVSNPVSPQHQQQQQQQSPAKQEQPQEQQEQEQEVESVTVNTASREKEAIT